MKSKQIDTAPHYYATIDDSNEKRPVICVWDDSNEEGGSSVTNAAERVVSEVVAKFGDYPICYRDTTGRWDGLNHDNGRFVGFASIGASDHAAAVAFCRTAPCGFRADEGQYRGA